MNLFLPFLVIREGVNLGLFKQTRRDGFIDAERIGGPDRSERSPDRFRPLGLEKLVPVFPSVWPMPGATGPKRLEFAPHPFGGIIPRLIGDLRAHQDMGDTLLIAGGKGASRFAPLISLADSAGFRSAQLLGTSTKKMGPSQNGQPPLRFPRTLSDHAQGTFPPSLHFELTCPAEAQPRSTS